MSLTDRLQTDMLAAMRGGDTHRRDTLRMVISATQLAAKDKRGPLSDEEAVEVIGREVRKRRESVEAFQGAGREDLAARELAEIEILTPYLPEQVGEAELRALVVEAIAASGATSPRDMGRVMSAVMPKVKGRADGKVVSAIATEELAKAGAA